MSYRALKDLYAYRKGDLIHKGEGEYIGISIPQAISEELIEKVEEEKSLEKSLEDKLFDVLPYLISRTVCNACVKVVETHYRRKVEKWGEKHQTAKRAVCLVSPDDFQDLLMTHRSDFSAVNLLLFHVHSGKSVTFPIEIGAAA